MIKLGISIVHYGDKEWLDRCIESLEPIKNNPYFDVRVFDCNTDNIGFTAANNKLIEAFLANQYEWIWLLNNDTVVPKETLDAIQEILPKIDEKVGLIGFKIRSMEDPDLIHHAGTVECYPGGIHKSGSVRLSQHKKRTNEKWVTFASVLVRSEVFRKIGLMDEHFFNYYSDSDFCYRARYAGYQIIYEPSFTILHRIGSSQNPSPEQKKMIRDDGLRFQNKWLNGKAFFDLDKELVE